MPDRILLVSPASPFNPQSGAQQRTALLYEALQTITKRYVDLVNCGDCGFWNPEQEPEVIKARAALAKTHPARGERA